MVALIELIFRAFGTVIGIFILYSISKGIQWLIYNKKKTIKFKFKVFSISLWILSAMIVILGKIKEMNPIFALLGLIFIILAVYLQFRNENK